MSGIVDDANFIFKKVLNVIDKTTGLGTVEYLYDDVKAGKEVKTKTPKAGALGGTPPPPEDLKGKGKTTLNTENLFGDEQPKESLYQDGRDSRSYAINKVVSGESGSKVEDKGDTINLGKAPRSLFNNWTLHRYANRAGQENFSKDPTNSIDYNRPVMKYGAGGTQMVPTANNIVEYARHSGGESFSYSYSDFIQMEHYGQISNDYLITLRRFAYPVGDDLLSPKQQGSDGKEPIDVSSPDLARAVTWLSPALGNDLKEILKFKTGFKWEEAKSEIQEAQSRSSDRGAVGAAIAGSSVGSAIESGLNGFTSVQAKNLRAQGNVDHAKETYPNKVFGPLNIIDNVLARGKGLKFEQEFKLTFHYDLKSFQVLVRKWHLWIH